MSASSTQVAHEGFPVALPESLYSGCIHAIADVGAIRVTLVGELRSVEQPLETAYRRVVGIPQVFLYVEDMQQLHGNGANPLFTACGGVIFEADEMHAAYVTFLPGVRGSLNEAVDWLGEAYVGDLFGGDVVTDFDELTPRFANAKFSVERVMNRRVEADDVTRVLTRAGASGAVNYFIGRVDHVTQNQEINISGSTVTAPVTIAESIESSFNRVEQAGLEGQVKEALEQLHAAVAAAAHTAPPEVQQSMARDLDAISKEVTSESPRSSFSSHAPKQPQGSSRDARRHGGSAP